MEFELFHLLVNLVDVQKVSAEIRPIADALIAQGAYERFAFLHVFLLWL